MKTYLKYAALTALPLLAACSQHGSVDQQRAEVQKPVEIKETGFDRGLVCLAPHIKQHLGQQVFAVLPFKDKSGKANYGESGTGTYLGQGAENWVIAALSLAGAKQRNVMIDDFFEVIYNRSPKSVQEKMREMALVPTISLDGAFTGLGWSGGGGAKLVVGGIGGSLRRFSTSISAVMTMSEVYTRAVMRSTKYDVITTATEVDIGVFRVFGQELYEGEAGFVDRQLLPFVEQATATWLAYVNIRSLVPDSPAVADCDKFVVKALENTKIVETNELTGEKREIAMADVTHLDQIERRPVTNRR
jgi:hypothetical protein